MQTHTHAHVQTHAHTRTMQWLKMNGVCMRRYAICLRQTHTHAHTHTHTHTYIHTPTHTLKHTHKYTHTAVARKGWRVREAVRDSLASPLQVPGQGGLISAGENVGERRLVGGATLEKALW